MAAMQGKDARASPTLRGTYLNEDLPARGQP